MQTFLNAKSNQTLMTEDDGIRQDTIRDIGRGSLLGVVT